jgi:hypothetical protein
MLKVSGLATLVYQPLHDLLAAEVSLRSGSRSGGAPFRHGFLRVSISSTYSGRIRDG